MPPVSSHPVLILTVKGDVTQGKLTGKQVTDATIQAYYKKKLAAECIGTYPYKALTLFIFGATAGPDELENKHQLPPPNDGTPCYGDILLLASKDANSFANPVPFKPEDYEAFYTKAFGGFDEDAASDEEEDETPADDVDDEAAVADDEAAVAPEEEADEEEEDEEADEEEEDDAGAAAVDDEDADGAVAVRPKRKAAAAAVPKKRKAAASKSAAAQANGSAYPDRPILSEAEQLHEELVPTAAGVKPKQAQRQAAVKHLAALFADRLDEEQTLNLERCIYNAALREATERKVVRSWDYPLFAHLYKMVLRRIACNFHPETYVQNGELFQSFEGGKISLDSLSAMSTYDLYPSRWKEQFDHQQQREKRQLEGNKSMATDQFLCTRCWKRECTYYEMQTRSADEPMTIFITCLNCGKHWRQ